MLVVINKIYYEKKLKQINEKLQMSINNAKSVKIFFKCYHV